MSVVIYSLFLATVCASFRRLQVLETASMRSGPATGCCLVTTHCLSFCEVEARGGMVVAVALRDRCILWAVTIHHQAMTKTGSPRLVTGPLGEMMSHAHLSQTTLSQGFLSNLRGSFSRLPADRRAPCTAVPTDVTIR